MAQKITSLTQEQWQEMREFREEQRKAALRTDTIDCDKARDAVNQLYTVNNQAPPKYIFFFQSPVQCLVVLNALREAKDDKLLNKLTAQGNKVINLHDVIPKYGFPQINANMWFIGGWDKFWVSFYKFAQRIGVEYKEDAAKRLDAYWDYTETCGIAYFYPEIALVSDRAEVISFDHMRRLHNDEGPALKFRDSYSVYAWHGQRVKSTFITERDKITPKQIQKEENVELRRILTEIYAHLHGPNAIIKDMGAKFLSKDVNHGQERVLYELNGDRFIHVKNGSLEPDGSRREFFLGAAPAAANPQEAVAASYGRPATKYKEAVRT